MQRKLVLRASRDAKFARERLGGLAHVLAANGIGQAQQQADAWAKIGGTKTGERLESLAKSLCAGQAAEFLGSSAREQQRDVRHALGAADNKNAASPLA